MLLIDMNELKQKVAEWLKPVKPDETVMVALDDIAISVLMTIEEQPVVHAVPLERIKQLREDIKGYKHGNGNIYTCALNKSVELIDNMIKEYEPQESEG